MNKKNPKTRYVMGTAAKPGVIMHALLPTKLFDFIMMHVS